MWWKLITWKISLERNSLVKKLMEGDTSSHHSKEQQFRVYTGSYHLVDILQKVNIDK